MIHIIRNTTVAGGVLAVLFAFAVTAHATDVTEVFLQSSLPLSVDIQSGTSTDAGLEVVATSTASGTEGSAWRQPYSYSASDVSKVGLFWQGVLKMFGFASSSQDSLLVEQEVKHVRVAKVSDMSVTLTWPSVLLADAGMKVYYASTSPVVVSPAAANVSPWKFWDRRQVTLRGLTPNTTYFYKVVVVTSLGTTTSAEASFKTLAR